MIYNSIHELFTGICDAIRAKDGTTAPINHVDIPVKILAINNFSTIKIDNICPVASVSVSVSTPTVSIAEAQVTSE